MPGADRGDARRTFPPSRWLVAGASAAALVLVLVLAVVTGGPGDDGPGDGSGPATVVPSASPSPTPTEDTVPGDEYAVSPDGDDDADGTADDPWRTLQHALAQLRPGDRLVVSDGRYDEDVDVDVREATEAKPIRVVAAEGARPVVQGLLWLSNLTWWDISGINVTWDDDNEADEHMVKLTDGAHWRFADAELWGARSYAALLVDGDPENFLLTGLYVHDTYPANETNQDHLVYLNCGTGGGVVERSVLARSENGRALKIGSADDDGDPVGNIVVRYVTMVDNFGPSNVQLAYDTSNVRIERSLMVGSADGRHNVTTYDLEGDGNVVADSLGWESAGVLEEADGLEDGGGNVTLDPELTGRGGPRPYQPQAEDARSYGRYADGDG